tara:strand:- start:13787 stop:14464 length:678 start_codon:yes stop_codon:yes gene_type:complete
MYKIALIDDDKNITTSLEMVLNSEGFKVCSYHDGSTALTGIKHTPVDIAILDIKMPRMDGLELYNKIKQFSDIPIIFLTSKDSELDELIGLKLGADDYVRKPFSHKLLIERIKNIMRRREPTKKITSINNKMRDLYIDNDSMTCQWKGQNVPLTSTEFHILRCLTFRPGIIKSRDDLINEAFKETLQKEDRAVDSHIKRIRRKFIKLDPSFDMIKTVYGAGYKIN